MRLQTAARVQRTQDFKALRREANDTLDRSWAEADDINATGFISINTRQTSLLYFVFQNCATKCRQLRLSIKQVGKYCQKRFLVLTLHVAACCI